MAAVTTAAILLLMGRLLLRDFVPVAASQGERLRISFIEREYGRDAAPAMNPGSARGPARTEAPLPPPARIAEPPRTPPRANESAPAPLDPTTASRVYTSIGQVRVPPGSRVDPMKAPEIAGQAPGLPNERELDKARLLLERRNPIEYERTVFDKDWKSDGTLGDVAAQSLGRGAKKIAEFVFGEDIQSSSARPPPDVRYNPALYERKSDLGRAETGDAYKAAPITFEKAPDLKGEASRRIRASMASLQQRVARCDAQKVRTLMQPVRAHLGELEQVEHAMANGADPVMAAQMLPRRGDSAYDLARRALWYADNQLADCAR